MRRIAVLISNSGSGSNLQALIDAQTAGYDGQIVAVISSKPHAYGLVRAYEADIPTEVLDFSEYREAGKPRSLYEQDLVHVLQKYAPDLIVCAGWMLVLSENFLRYFPWRVLNLHPGLLGEDGQPFRLPNGQFADPCTGLAGENAIKAVLAAGQPFAGSTVHVVVPSVDAGPVVMRGLVRVRQDDTVDSLYHRLKGKEHEIMVESLRQLCRPAKTVRQE